MRPSETEVSQAAGALVQQLRNSHYKGGTFSGVVVVVMTSIPTLTLSRWSFETSVALIWWACIPLFNTVRLVYFKSLTFANHYNLGIFGALESTVRAYINATIRWTRPMKNSTVYAEYSPWSRASLHASGPWILCVWKSRIFCACLLLMSAEHTNDLLS